ncbi:hypothetical protein ACFC1R_35780 [Kitasatospora sp. NPDC056138]|uniref:hypothetical protein n=1 Tax=Kitasatospora sp. NPDC056138 TaxID=3345724 RepID=UPI0035DD5D8D
METRNGFLMVVLAAHEWSGDPVNVEPDERARVGRISTAAIPENFVPTTASALTRYLVGGPDVSLDGWAHPIRA